MLGNVPALHDWGAQGLRLGSTYLTISGGPIAMQRTASSRIALTRTASLIAAVAVAAVLTLAWAVAPGRSEALAYEASNLVMQGFDETSCGGCSWCVHEDGIGHFTSSANGLRKLGPNGAHEDCDLGTCDDEHPYQLEKCRNGGESFAGSSGETPVTLPSLWFAAVEASSEELQRLVAEHPTSMYINRDREVLQFVGCDGQVMAQLPLHRTKGTVLAE